MQMVHPNESFRANCATVLSHPWMVNAYFVKKSHNIAFFIGKQEPETSGAIKRRASDASGGRQLKMTKFMIQHGLAPNA